ncbi:MAG: aldo/keto reductase [Acidimicrobiales bacterium]
MTVSLINTAARTIGPFEVGPLAFGCWRLTTSVTDDARALVETALDLGLNLIDNADVYGFDWGGGGFGANEEVLGAVLASAPSLRERMVLATKGGIVPPTPYDSSPLALEAACDASLRRLQTDVIDVYQIHRPDLFSHPADVAATLTRLREKGKIREVGVSNHTPAQHEALAAHLPFPILTTQPEYSPAVLTPLRDGTFDLCLRDGVVPLAWSPLAGGRLVSGEGIRPELLAVLDDLAERENVDRAAICLAFVLAHPSAPVAILGTQTPARLATAATALGVMLDRADVYAIVQASEGVPLP